MNVKKVRLILIVIVTVLSCVLCSGIKKTYSKSGEITVKAIKNPDKTITRVFYSKGKEISRQIQDRNGDVIKTVGKIPDGAVKEYYESGKLMEEADYKNGKREGISKWYYENGLLKGERNYKDGKLDGIIKWYYSTGSLGTEFNYKSGKLEGLTKLYWENGNIKAEHNYKDGKRDGVNKQYYESGELRFIYLFKNGQRISRKTYNRSGKLLSEQNDHKGQQ